MGKRFDEFIQRKKELGVLYQHTFTGNDICGNCIYRKPWQDICAKFNKQIERKNQGNSYYDRKGNWQHAFHHLPCEECLSYKIQKQDLQYYINSYKKKFPNRKISEFEVMNE